MKISLLIIFTVLITSIFYAQNEGVSGARAYGLAGTSSLQSDLWSTNNNPAGLAGLKKWQAGVSYEN